MNHKFWRDPPDERNPVLTFTRGRNDSSSIFRRKIYGAALIDICYV